MNADQVVAFLERHINDPDSFYADTEIMVVTVESTDRGIGNKVSITFNRSQANRRRADRRAPRVSSQIGTRATEEIR